MKKKSWAHRIFESRKDEDGSNIIIVSLGGKKKKNAEGFASGNAQAVIDEATFLELCEMGLSLAWNLNSEGQVQAYSGKASGKKVGVARVITDAQPGDLVKYKDGDSKNLRASNLSLRKGEGWSTRADRELV